MDSLDLEVRLVRLERRVTLDRLDQLVLLDLVGIPVLLEALVPRETLDLLVPLATEANLDLQDHLEFRDLPVLEETVENKDLQVTVVYPDRMDVLVLLGKLADLDHPDHPEQEENVERQDLAENLVLLVQLETVVKLDLQVHRALQEIVVSLENKDREVSLASLVQMAEMEELDDLDLLVLRVPLDLVATEDLQEVLDNQVMMDHLEAGESLEAQVHQANPVLLENEV